MGDEGQAPGSTGKCMDINNVLFGTEWQGICKRDCCGEQEGGTDHIGTGRVVTGREVHYN